MSTAALAEIAPRDTVLERRIRGRADGQSVRSQPQQLDVLVRENQPLLHHILKRFASSGEPYEDLLQVANVGLIKAARNYDPDHGTQFSTYAVAVVDGEVRHYLRDCLLLRQPRWARRAYADIQHAITMLGHKLGRPPTVAEIAAAVNITETGVLEVMALSARVELEAYDETMYAYEQRGLDIASIRSQHAESFALPIEDRIALEAALEKLSDFQRRLIELLFYREFTQREVAEALGITTKKVSRELAKSLRRLHELMGRRVF